MAKKDRSPKRQAKRGGAPSEVPELLPLTPQRDKTPLEPRNETQRRYASAMRTSPLVFGLGPAGTGKTFIAGAVAAEALMDERVDKIIITRPAVEAGESLGYLPGEKEEKFEPYLTPFRDVLNERLGKGFVDYLIEVGRVEAAPLAYMRGRTFKRAFVILDEAQNTTPEQMKLFLTRIGDGCNVVINGDESQKDIKGPSGLLDAANRLIHIPVVKIVMFRKADIVRSGLVQEIVEAYEAPAPDRLHPMLAR